jgi:ATP-dependent DNA helicase RecQ
MVGDDPHARSGIDEPLLRTDSRVDQAEGGPKASYYWTWRLFRDGYTVDQVRQIRNLSQESVVQELREAAKNRLVVETDWLDP